MPSGVGHLRLSETSARPDDAPSRSLTSAASTSAAASSRRAASPGEHIEMEPVAGHRRRKSSLLNPVSTHPGSLPNRLAGHAPHGHHSSTLPPQDPSMMEPSAGGPEGSDCDDAASTTFSDDDTRHDEELGLSAGDRSRRKKKRRKNTLLDNRIAREKSLTADDRKVADKSVAKRLLVNGTLIALWYLFSLSISLYNKWMFDRDRLNFAFPLFTTSMHMLVQFLLSGLVLYFVPALRPPQARSSDRGRSRHELEPNQAGMSKMFYLTRIGPCGAATSLDIGLGNTSLKFISLTFYTMCKSSSLAFVLLFAFLFRLEAPTWRLVAIIATMTLGVVLMVFGEIEFKIGGFILVISAAFFSGFRWGLTQILLLRNPATSNPFSSIFFLTPVMFVTLLFLAIPVEGFVPFWEGLMTLANEWGAVTTPLFLLFPGCIAFLMTASEFALLQRTSVVTLSIAGIFKEVVTISAASVVFKDRLTFINLVGLLTTMVAIVAYNYVKIDKMRQEARDDLQAHHGYTGSASPTSENSDSVSEDEAIEEAAGLLHHQLPSVVAKSTPSASDGDGDAQPGDPPPRKGLSRSGSDRIECRSGHKE